MNSGAGELRSEGRPAPTGWPNSFRTHPYQKRWPVEVDNYYVKQLLGLGDFRVQSYEAVEKWFALVFLAYTFLQWRLNHAPPEENFKTIADVIRSHRQEHARYVLEAACEEALHWQDTAPVFERFICQFEPVMAC